MNKKAIIFISAVSLLAIGGTVWAIRKFRPFNKDRAVQYLAKKKNLSVAGLAEMGNDYVIARAEALRSGKELFSVGGKNFNTGTGKVA